MPAWLPATLFAVLTIGLFREFIVSNGMLFGTDVTALGYFARKFYADFVRTHHAFPLWNPFLFGGLPFVDAMHGDIFYPTTVLKFIMPVHRAMGWKIVLHVFLAGLFTYGWLRHLKVSRGAALFGGATYLLAPVMVSLIYPGHDGKLFVTALTPLALWVTDWAVIQGGLWRFAALALVVALLILTPHIQLAYFATWAVGALGIFRLAQAYRSGRGLGHVSRRLGALVLAGFLGAAAIGAAQLWTPLRYLTTYSQRVAKTTGAETERGYAYSTSYSLHPEEAFSLLVPEFIGENISKADGTTVNTYWGRNPFKLNHEYSGLIPLLLIPLAFFSRRRRGGVIFFSAVAGVSLIFALGATTPLFWLFYLLVPGVKLFRAPSSIMFIFAIAVVTAAALGLDGARDVLESRGNVSGRRDAESREEAGRLTHRSVRYLWGAAAVFVVLAVLGSIGAFTQLWTATLYRGIRPDKLAALQNNLPNIQRGLWIAAFLAAALAGAWHLRVRGSIPRAGWLGAVVALSILDLWRVDGLFIQVMNPDRLFPRDDTTQYLMEQVKGEPPFRAFMGPQAPYDPDHFAIYGIEQMAGHHGNEMGRYLDLIDQLNGNILRLLNVRYVVAGAQLNTGALQEAYRGRRSLVYRYLAALPRAFLVTRYESLPDSMALDRLRSADFDPGKTAILERELDALLDPTATGRVAWTQRGINSFALQVETTGRALLIVSDNYYPAWHVTLDGQPVPLLRADYTLRGVVIPEGTHQVRFHYHSPLFQAAVWTSILTGLGALVLVLAGAVRTRTGDAGGRGEQAESGGGGNDA